MNIISNDTLIKRNARLSQIVMIAGLVVLGGGMFISFRFTDARYFYLTLLALLLGFILSQVGIHYANHFGRHPRPDESMNSALKGLDAKYTLYHYLTPVPHLLIGPAGIWILMPRAQKGRITYRNGRWKQSGGNWYLKIFAQEGLGRPDIDAAAEVDKLTKYFEKNLPEGTSIPTIQTALVFTDPKIVVDIPEDADPPAQTVTADKLKETIRKVAKSRTVNQQQIQLITGLFPNESK